MRFLRENNSIFTDMILYNGTDTDYDKVDFNKVNLHDDGYLGRGFYLSSDPEYAKNYGDIIKEFIVNPKNPFCFNDIDYNMKRKLMNIILDNYLEKILDDNTPTFVYYLERLSNDESCTYVAKKIHRGKATEEDIAYIILKILSSPNHIFKGALHDFSKGITKYLKMNGYDGAYINFEGKEAYEYVAFNENSLKLLN